MASRNSRDQTGYIGCEVLAQQISRTSLWSGGNLDQSASRLQKYHGNGQSSLVNFSCRKSPPWSGSHPLSSLGTNDWVTQWLRNGRGVIDRGQRTVFIWGSSSEDKPIALSPNLHWRSPYGH